MGRKAPNCNLYKINQNCLVRTNSSVHAWTLATLLKANQIKVVKVEKSPRPTAGLRTISTSGHGHAQAFDPRTLALNARSMHTWSQCKSEWGSNRSGAGLVLVLVESCWSWRPREDPYWWMPPLHSDDQGKVQPSLYSPPTVIDSTLDGSSQPPPV